MSSSRKSLADGIDLGPGDAELRSARLALPRWTGQAGVAVSLTFDVDCEAALTGLGVPDDRLSTVSAAQFGITRGLPRLLAFLSERSIGATFYVPGQAATRYPDEIRAILDAGHEVGHHGHDHLRSDSLDLDGQREELERGLEALDACLGIRPTGYRSPSWELTPETLGLLLEMGFTYDSSLMGDDRPYRQHCGARSLIELPVHWSLDDWAYYAFAPDRSGRLSDISGLLGAWKEEFESALGDGRHVTYTMHPEIIGRGYWFSALRQLVEYMESRGTVWFAQHHEVVALYEGPNRRTGSEKSP